MTRKTNIRAVLLGAAATAAFVPMAQAATVIFPQGVDITPGTVTEQDAQGTTQIQLDNGAVVSIVGAAEYSLDGNRFTVRRGSFTVMSGEDGDIVFDFGDGRTVTFDGSGVVQFDGQAISANVYSGRIVALGGGRTVTYRTGSRFRIVGTDVPTRVVANGAVTTVALSNGGISGAALNGLPVSLGEALRALGADADIVDAARAVDLRIEDARLAALPTGDLEALIAFQSALATYVGADGQLFAGSNPQLINLYLRYLATGGQIAQFQSAYVSILSSYLEILRTAGLPSTFTTISLTDIQTYLNYIDSVGRTTSLSSVQQQIVAEYLAFIRAGGIPDAFFFSNAQISAEMQAEFSSALASYLLFIREGGVAADFTGVDITLIRRYINSLQVNGLLGSFFTDIESQVLVEYLSFLADGGAPNDFTGFTRLPLGPTLAASYVTTLNSFITFIEGGGSPTAFSGLTEVQFLAFVNALERSGFLVTLLPNSRAALLSYVSFLQSGGNFANLGSLPGFVTVDTQITVVQNFITFLSNGGNPANFTGVPTDVLRVYLATLQSSGVLATNFSGQLNVLVEYLTFLQGGGDPSTFTGFSVLPIGSVLAAQYVTSLQSFITFIQGGGTPTEFDGLTQAQFLLYVDALERAGLLASLLPTQRTILLNYVTVIRTGGTFNDIVQLPAFVPQATQVSAIQSFLVFVRNGNSIANYTAVSPAVLLEYIRALDAAGQLSGIVTAQELTILRNYVTFVRGGGTVTTFTGFTTLPIGSALVQQYTNSLRSFLTFIRSGGVPSQFSGLTAEQLATFVQELDEASALANNFTAADTTLLRDYAAFVRGGGALDSFSGLPTVDVRLIASINSDAVVNFTPDFVKVAGVYRQSDLSFGRVSGSGTATIGTQNQLTELRTRSGGLALNLAGSTLVALNGDDDILMARFSVGSFGVNGQSVNLSQGGFVDIVAVSNPAEILPASGSANYSLKQTLGLQTSNSFSGPTSVDLDVAVQFGATPTFSMTGTFNADSAYAFGAQNGQIVGGTLSATGGFTSGTGQFCAQISNCSVVFEGNMTQALDQIGASFSSVSDAATFAGVGILDRTN